MSIIHGGHLDVKESEIACIPGPNDSADVGKIYLEGADSSACGNGGADLAFLTAFGFVVVHGVFDFFCKGLGIRDEIKQQKGFLLLLVSSMGIICHLVVACHVLGVEG